MIYASKSQVIQIHIAKKELTLSEEQYRDAVRSYGVEHANRLSYKQAEDLLKKFEAMGFKAKINEQRAEGKNDKINYGFGKKKYECLRNREKFYAAPGKLRKIEAMWRSVSREKTDAALQSFINNLVHISDITFLHNDHANKVIKALEEMEKQLSVASDRLSVNNKKED